MVDETSVYLIKWNVYRQTNGISNNNNESIEVLNWSKTYIDVTLQK
jgi:hypothetical protein